MRGHGEKRRKIDSRTEYRVRGKSAGCSEVTVCRARHARRDKIEGILLYYAEDQATVKKWLQFRGAVT